MKGLHNYRTPPPEFTMRWYAAVVARRGRRHLLSVPTLTLDFVELVRNNAPLSYRYRYLPMDQRIEQAEQDMRMGRNIAFPAYVRPDANGTQRQCTRQQRVNMWEYEPLSTEHYASEPPRAFCETCWNEWATWMPHTATMRRANPEATLTAAGDLTGAEADRQSIADWRANARRNFRLR